MVDSKQPSSSHHQPGSNSMNGQSPPNPATTNLAAATQNDPSLNNPPRKDHYSYSYKYKTAADPDSGVPGCNTVEVNESVTEEIGPDGSKIIRRHQQEKQVNKITQVVTQRVIKRQYIDPSTGQIIEYDPNNELFANLPPETVFEEHTIISDDSSGNPPIVTTTTLSKTAPNAASNKNLNATANALVDQFSTFSVGDNSGRRQQQHQHVDYVDNSVGLYSSVKMQHHINSNQYTTDNVVTTATAMKIKSHPEDNQGYPEERNMDYDPDDSYHDDDSPYEGLVQGPCRDDDDCDEDRHNRNRRRHGHSNKRRDVDSINIVHHHHHHHQQQQQQQQQHQCPGQQHSGGSSTGSSSPILYDPQIDMPQV
jgi:hypothetical protein